MTIKTTVMVQDRAMASTWLWPGFARIARIAKTEKGSFGEDWFVRSIIQIYIFRQIAKIFLKVFIREPYRPYQKSYRKSWRYWRKWGVSLYKHIRQNVKTAWQIAKRGWL